MPDDTNEPHVVRLFSLEEVLKLIPVSRRTLYNLMDDGEFPKPFYLTPRLFVWKESDILEWQDSLHATRFFERQRRRGRRPKK